MVRKNGTKSIVVALFAVALVLPWHKADAATGTTAVTLAMPANVILSYQPTLALTFTAGYDLNSNEGAGAATVAALGTPVTFDAAITTSAVAAAPTTLAVTVSNAFTVRGTGTVTVGITLDTAAATNGASSATASALTVQTTTPAAGPGASISFAGQGMGLVNAVAGDVHFNLDISSVTLTGNHTGMQWTITATAI